MMLLKYKFSHAFCQSLSLRLALSLLGLRVIKDSLAPTYNFLLDAIESIRRGLQRKQLSLFMMAYPGASLHHPQGHHTPKMAWRRGC